MFQCLQQQAELWDKASRLRSFISCCEAHLVKSHLLGTDPAAMLWLEWAGRCVEELDPFNSDYLLNNIRTLREGPIRAAPAE